MSLRGALLLAALGAVISGACGGGASSDPASPAAIITGPARESTPTAAAEATRTPTPTAAATATPMPATATAVPTSAPAATAPPQANPTAPAPQPTAPPRASAVSITVTASDLKFDRSLIRVAAGATVTATLQNNDAGVAHNLSFSLAGLSQGETCSGPCSATQTFKADKAGTYFFLCTLHDMVGSFIVDP